MNKLRFLSLNVRGLLDAKKRNRFLLWIKNQKPDVVFLQETFFTKGNIGQISRSFKDFGYKDVNSLSDSNHSRGVTILLSEKINYDIVKDIVDNEGRMIMLNVTINGVGLSLVNVYAPNQVTQRVVFFYKTEYNNRRT